MQKSTLSQLMIPSTTLMFKCKFNSNYFEFQTDILLTIVNCLLPGPNYALVYCLENILRRLMTTITLMLN